MPGTATDIGNGADGSVFAVGTQDVSPTGGYNIMKWNGTGWDIYAPIVPVYTLLLRQMEYLGG